MELYVWKGSDDGSLLSFDPFCLQAVAYARFSNASIRVVYSNNPRLSPTGNLPYLKDGDTLVGGMAQIIAHLASKGYDTDSHLSRQQQGEAQALCAYLDTALTPLLVHEQYDDSTHYYQRRSWLVRQLAFPLNYTVPRMVRHTCLARYLDHLLRGLTSTPESTMDTVSAGVTRLNFGPTLTTIQPRMEREERDEEINDKLKLKAISKATQCLQDIILRLQSSNGDPFFYGRRPSSVDAVLYGLSAYALCKDDTIPEFKKLLSSHPPIVSHYDVIVADYLPAGYSFPEPEVVPATHTTRHEEHDHDDIDGYGYQDTEEDFLREKRRGEMEEMERQMQKRREEERDQMATSRYLTYAVAGAAMLLYAVASGFLGPRRRMQQRGHLSSP